MNTNAMNEDAKNTTTMIRTARAAAATLTALLLTVPAAGCGNLDGDLVEVSAVAYAPDGSLLVLTNPALHMFDGQLGTEKRTFPFPPGTSPRRFMLSPDGGTAAVDLYTRGDEIALIDLATGQRAGGVAWAISGSGASEVEDMVMSNGGELVFGLGSRGNDRAGWMMEPATGQFLWMTPWRLLPALTPDGATLFLSNFQDQLVDAVDGRSGEAKFSIPAEAEPSGMVLANGGRELVASLFNRDCPLVPGPHECPENYVVWSTADGTVSKSFPMLFPNSASYGSGRIALAELHCASDAGICVSGVVQFTDDRVEIVAHVWSTADGRVISSISIPSGSPHDMALNADGSLLAIAAFGGEHGVLVYRTSDGQLVGRKVFHTGVF